MNENFKKRLWIGGGVIVGSIIVALIGFYLLSTNITKQADYVVNEKTIAQNGVNAIANFAALEMTAPQAARYEGVIQKIMPDQSGLITFNAWADQIAKKYGVTASVAYQGDPVSATAGVPGTVGFTMTAQGPEGSIAPFVDDISSGTPGFILSFNSSDFTNNQTQENITSQGTLYFR